MAIVPIRITRTQKPPLGTPIDWGNPLTTGFRCAIAFNEMAGGSIFESVTETVGRTNGGVLWKPEGLDLGSGDVNRYIDFTTNSSWNILGAITCIARVFISVAGQTDPTIVSKNTTNSVTNTPYEFGLYSTGGNYYLKFGRANSAYYAVWAGSQPIPVGRWITVAVTATAAMEVAPLFFISGVLTGSVSIYGGTGTGSPTGNNNTLRIGNRQDGVADFPGVVGFVAVAADVKHTLEIASLSANPWQIYEPEIVWVEVGSSAGATTSTADPDSLAVTCSATIDYRGLISGATVGALVAAGVEATSVKGFLSVAESGTAAITGTNSTGTRTLISATETGDATTSGTNTTDYVGHISVTQTSSITATGADSTGVYTPVGSTTSTAQPGAAVILGVNASGVRTLISLTEPGAVNLTGVNASGFRVLISVTETGAIAVTGTNSADTTGELISIAPYSSLSVNGYNTTDYRPGREIPIIRGRELSLTSGRTIPVIQ